MIVLSDGIKIGIVRKGGLGKEISCVAPEVWIVAKQPEVHEKAVAVRKIKSGKRHIQADIRLRDIVPKQEPPFRQPLLQPIKGTKDQMKGIAVGSLALFDVLPLKSWDSLPIVSRDFSLLNQGFSTSRY